VGGGDSSAVTERGEEAGDIVGFSGGGAWGRGD